MTDGSGSPKDVKAFEWASNNFSHRIAYDDMRYGDIVTQVKCDSIPLYEPGHVYFFDEWVDNTHDEFWAYESTQVCSCACRRSTSFNHGYRSKTRQTNVNHRGLPCALITM